MKKLVALKSRRDFIHKSQITLKELKESFYWLRLIRKAALFSEENPLLSSLLEENTNDQLKNYTAAAIRLTDFKYD